MNPTGLGALIEVSGSIHDWIIPGQSRKDGPMGGCTDGCTRPWMCGWIHGWMY